MAQRSLTLAAYRAYSRRGFRTVPTFVQSRPPGELIWLHCPDPEMRDGALCLAERLLEIRSGSHILLTGEPPPTTPDAVICDQIPADQPSACRSFLRHWKPDLVLWLGGWLRPNLVEEATRMRLPMLLLWARRAGFDGRRDRWLPELSRYLLRRFSKASATDTETRQKLLRLGMPGKHLELTSDLKRTGRVLPCDPEEQDEVARAVAGRPVWLAASVLAGEVGTVLAAHQDALRREHRLLLLLVPADANAYAAAREGLADFVMADWAEGQLPSDQHSVLLTEDADDLGLWYRLASVSLLGGTLTGSTLSRDPLEAAALGSALLYGPHLGDHLDTYSRLSQAGAARIVNDAASLAAAISSQIAPDKAAAMAHAGWDVATEGGPAIDRVVAQAQDILDGVEAA